ncbi:MAG TPA: hypothetical protein VGI21_16960 [Streptosporangiaceae bacterium]
MPEQHEMMLVGKTESGAEKWQCPQCGRSMLMRWPPRFESQVIEEGDTSVAHRGIKGGVQLGPVEVEAHPARLSDEEEQWLRRIGIDWPGAA